MEIQKFLAKHYQSRSIELGFLEQKILRAIQKRERNFRLAGILIWSATFISSALGFAYSLILIINRFSTSGFGELLSIIPRDSGLVSSYSADLFYSLAESFPAAPLIGGLFAIAFALLALRGIINNENSYLKIYGYK